MGLYEVARYLCLEALSGRCEVVEGLYLYFRSYRAWSGPSISEIARALGMSRSRLRGYVEQCIAAAGTPRRACAAVLLLAPTALRLRPIATRVGSAYRCGCGFETSHPVAILRHVRERHRAEVEKCIATLIDAALTRRSEAQSVAEPG